MKCFRCTEAKLGRPGLMEGQVRVVILYRALSGFLLGFMAVR